MRKIPFIFLCSIIALAALGLVTQLATDPVELFISIVRIALIAGVLFAIVYFLFFRSKNTSQSSNKYKQAVKQSQEKYGKPNKQRIKSNSTKKPLKKRGKRKVNHLRVIEGKKSKKDDRASY